MNQPAAQEVAQSRRWNRDALRESVKHRETNSSLLFKANCRVVPVVWQRRWNRSVINSSTFCVMFSFKYPPKSCIHPSHKVCLCLSHFKTFKPICFLSTQLCQIEMSRLFCSSFFFTFHEYSAWHIWYFKTWAFLWSEKQFLAVRFVCTGCMVRHNVDEICFSKASSMAVVGSWLIGLSPIMVRLENLHDYWMDCICWI